MTAWIFQASILQLREGSTILTSVETILHFLALEFVEEVEECLLGVMERCGMSIHHEVMQKLRHIPV